VHRTPTAAVARLVLGPGKACELSELPLSPDWWRRAKACRWLVVAGRAAANERFFEAGERLDATLVRASDSGSLVLLAVAELDAPA
jgi:hypothetical protein